MTNIKKTIAGLAVVAALAAVFLTVAALESGAITAVNALLTTVVAVLVEAVALKNLQ